MMYVLHVLAVWDSTNTNLAHSGFRPDGTKFWQHRQFLHSHRQRPESALSESNLGVPTAVGLRGDSLASRRPHTHGIQRVGPGFFPWDRWAGRIGKPMWLRQRGVPIERRCLNPSSLPFHHHHCLVACRRCMPPHCLANCRIHTSAVEDGRTLGKATVGVPLRLCIPLSAL